MGRIGDRANGDTAGQLRPERFGLLLDNLIDTDQLPQLCGLACDFRLQSFDEPVSFS
jgi:hypothetical protein